jgi:hypothetical protein
MTVMYLPQPTLAAAQARSNQQALALNCDGVRTKYWWSVQAYAAPDTNGNMAAIVINTGTAFDVTATNAKVAVPTGLTAPEQATLQTAPQVASLLPVVVNPLAAVATVDKV